MQIGEFKFASRINPQRLQKSQIRTLLALAESGHCFAEGQQNVVSLAGGFPDPATFPVAALQAISDRLIGKYSQRSLAYSPATGITEVKEFLADYYGKKYGIHLSPENILITTSSQQALDLVARAFCEKGNTVLCSSPSYLGAIQAFRFAGSGFATQPIEQDGISIDGYENLINATPKIAFHYEIPFNQNPGGVTLSKSKAEFIAKATLRHRIPIIEDNPYCELWFDKPPDFCSFLALRHDNVLSLHTVSKTIAPGLRMGFIIGPPEIIAKLGEIKQPADLCTSALNQLMVYEYMASGQFEPHLAEIRALYKDKCNAMLEAADEFLPKDLVSWNNPQGGLFLWFEFLRGLNAHEILEESLRQVPYGVAFVEGAQFCPDGRNTGARINFSYPSKQEIITAMKVLGEVIRKISEKKIKVL